MSESDTILTVSFDRGFATGGVQWTLRLEGLAIFAAAVAAYGQVGGVWWLFLVLFLWPDLAFLAYIANQRVGAIVYDAVHSYIGPVLLGILAYFADVPAMIMFALIWTAHIGLDRTIGYGLKYPISPNITHLGPKGKKSATGE